MMFVVAHSSSDRGGLVERSDAADGGLWMPWVNLDGIPITDTRA